MTLLASFFLPSHLSFVYVCVLNCLNSISSSLFFPSLSPQRMDMERCSRDALDPNLRHKPRLISEEELPSWLLRGDEEVGD